MRGGYYDEEGDFIEVGERDPFNELDAIALDLREASRAPNGGVNSDIQQLVNFQRIQQERNGAEALAVNTAPLSAIQNSDPKFGDVATVTAGGITVEVVRWTGNVNEARAVSISIGIADILPTDGTFTPTASAAARPYAIIQYGSRNFVKQVKVDVGKGINISLVASKVTVSVGLDIPSGGTAYGTMLLGASMGFGGSPLTAPVTSTIYIDSSLAASGSTSFTIPTGARTLLPIQRSFAAPGNVLTPAAMRVDVKDRNGTTIYVLYGGDTLYSVMATPLPLANDAYSMTVNNVDAAIAIPTMRFMFQLEF